MVTQRVASGNGILRLHGRKGLLDLLTGGPPAWALIDFTGFAMVRLTVEPAAYDQTTPIEPHIGKDDYHLSEDLADQAIKWIRQQQTSTPDSPFFAISLLRQFTRTPSTERMDRQIRRSV